ncbi:MAG TPA: fused MFS/spermidine synthase [Edaphobacter sp.]|nr:fused MFS/spermidine synthase [Edaphobacter sp.]
MPLSWFLYGTLVFLGAFLLFMVEPMAAKQLLPTLGGSSAVWLTCLVFFQVALLLGYLYAHWLTRESARKWTQQLYLVSLVAAAALLGTQSIHPHLAAQGSEHPVTTIFQNLVLTIGLPFLLLGATSPLLQLWFLRTQGGSIPYRLFALSNLGSLLALIAYPILIEPNLSLKHQRTVWLIGFIIYAIFCAILALQSNQTAEHKACQEEPITAKTPTFVKWLWFLLPMVAAMQLSAVTGHLTINIAAIPLLWMLPLAAYLLTFILAFEYPGLYRRGIVIRLLVIMLASLGYAISKTDVSLPIGVAILFFLAECFFAGLFCHAETYALRPLRPTETTLFYLTMAAGGAAGTFFVGIASPLLFSANYDLAISFFLTATVAIAVTWRDGWPQRLLWITASVLLFIFAIMLHAAYTRDAVLQARNFYGTLRVKETTTTHADPERMLLNGTIQHGTQIFGDGLTRTPTTYYAVDSGIGLALRFCCTVDDSDAVRSRNIGVVGLGAGTLAAYGHSGDRIRFYEINPLVQPIAQNLFTYLRDSQAQITFADGDARASLTREVQQNFDVLAIDAFSGDAIPLHLLTTEAFALYKRHLAPNGIIAVHVSNQYLNLAPEIAQQAIASNMQSRLVESPGDDATGSYRSTWVLVTNSSMFFSRPEISPLVAETPITPGLRPWTDDYSSLLPVIQLTHH